MSLDSIAFLKMLLKVLSHFIIQVIEITVVFTENKGIFFLKFNLTIKLRILFDIFPFETSQNSKKLYNSNISLKNWTLFEFGLY